MITWGFVVSYSDVMTVGVPISTTVNGKLTPLVATFVGITGTSGNIVWLNALGIPQYLPGGLVGQSYPIGATQIVASATVNGVARTTTATGFCYLASPSAV